MIDFITEDFEPSSAAAWKQKIQFELDGADFNKTLLTATNEGITIKPFYHSDSFEKISVPDSKGNYKICQIIRITSEEEANPKAIDAIEKGANAIKFNVLRPFNSEVLFKDLLGKNINFHFDFSFLTEDFIQNLILFLKNETIYLNIDIIGNLARTGNWYQNLNSDFKIIENLLQKNNSIFVLSVNVDVYQNSGANTVQQVAYALAHVNEYLTRFGENISNKIQFNFSTGSNFFFEISKTRAFKYLYNLILTKYNSSENVQIYSGPSLRNKIVFNKELNKLRSISENTSAIFGGVDTISSSSLEGFESVKETFTDIATDSYYIESITKQLAEKALSIFKEIEKSGGFLSQLKEGTIQRKIKENAQKEQQQIDSKELILAGSNPKELDKTNFDLALNPLKKIHPRKTLIIPITPHRLTEKLEEKRLKNEA